MEVPVILYKKVKPRDYITTHVKWVRLNEQQTKELRNHFERGWETGKHITTFTLCLNKEQKQLLDEAGVTITNVNKNLRYMLDILDSGKFDKDVMMEWTGRAQNVRHTPIRSHSLKQRNSKLESSKRRVVQQKRTHSQRRMLS